MSTIQKLIEHILASNHDDTSNLLRKARVTFNKLNLPELEEWAKKELNGYAGRSNEKLPLYRFTTGTIKACRPELGFLDGLFNTQEHELEAQIPIFSSIIDFDFINPTKSPAKLVSVNMPSTFRKIYWKAFYKHVKKELMSEIEDDDEAKKKLADINQWTLLFMIKGQDIYKIKSGIKDTLLELTLQLKDDNKPDISDERNSPQEKPLIVNIEHYQGNIGHFINSQIEQKF